MAAHAHHPAGARWRDHAERELRRGGTRAGGARTAVVAALAEQECCASAQEIHDAIRDAGGAIGIASIYRSLELLHRHGLIARVDTGDGVARYEPIDPSGEHHHHLVCERCGAVEAFHDDGLEEAIRAVAARVDFAVTGHDVVLRGTCRDCRARA